MHRGSFEHVICCLDADLPGNEKAREFLKNAPSDGCYRQADWAADFVSLQTVYATGCRSQSNEVLQVTHSAVLVTGR